MGCKTAQGQSDMFLYYMVAVELQLLLDHLLPQEVSWQYLHQFLLLWWRRPRGLPELWANSEVLYHCSGLVLLVLAECHRWMPVPVSL